jgi:hypothetical protein
MSVGVATKMPVELRFSSHKSMFINRLKHKRAREMVGDLGKIHDTLT